MAHSSDTKINQYLRRGTTAQLAANENPIPPTPVGGDPIHGYFQYDTTLGLFYGWDGAAWDRLSFAGTLGATDNAIPRADGVGGATFQASLITIDDTGALGLPDDVRQTFNPGANNAGLNVGSLAGDPATPSNGDVWYNSTTNKFRARENGTNVNFGTGDVVGPAGATAERIVTFDGATGKLVKDSGYLVSDLLNSPQMADQDDYTLVLADAGRHYYHVSATPHTLTIPANASVAFPIGTVINIENENGAGNITLAITSDTLRWGSSTGSRTIAANGGGSIMKVTATVWRLRGEGIT